VTADLAAYGGGNFGTVPEWLRYTVWAAVAIGVLVYLVRRWTRKP
jgi:ABC-type multidrug transport system permease subunit